MDDVVGSAADVVGGHAADFAHKGEVVADAHIAVEGDGFGQVADVPPRL